MRPLGLIGKFSLVAAVAVAAWSATGVSARRVGADEPVVLAPSALPVEAQTTLRLIRTGGPFPYRKDGIVFGNRERLLPIRQRGYYHEYTVPTPGERDRGARRIVCGGLPVTEPDICYYTADHYASFRRIAR